jgi:hypothetical protein
MAARRMACRGSLLRSSSSSRGGAEERAEEEGTEPAARLRRMGCRRRATEVEEAEAGTEQLRRPGEEAAEVAAGGTEVGRPLREEAEEGATHMGARRFTAEVGEGARARTGARRSRPRGQGTSRGPRTAGAEATGRRCLSRAGALGRRRRRGSGSLVVPAGAAKVCT